MYSDQEELRNLFEEVLKDSIYGIHYRENLATKLVEAYEKYRKECIKEIAKDLNDRADTVLCATVS